MKDAEDSNAKHAAREVYKAIFGIGCTEKSVKGKYHANTAFYNFLFFLF